jgi:hypothetical protein
MINRLIGITLIGILLFAAGLLAGTAARSSGQTQAQRQSQITAANVGTPGERCAKQDTRPSPVRPYHQGPPTGPLPATLDPAQFKEKRTAFVSYSIAARIKELLYQEPCYCECNKMEGHESLLDCYTSKHGEYCPTCQSEVFFIYEQHKLGKTAAEIRDGLGKGDAFKSDAKQYADAHYTEYAQPTD